MIEVIRTGSQLCIVDEGRFGYRKFGVPISGAMDRSSAISANSHLHNHPNAALLECYQPGHQFRFHSDALISLAGAQCEVFRNEEKIPYSEPIFLACKDVLSIGKMTRGCRIYLAVNGGVRTHSLMGSRSPLPGFLNRHIRKGDRIPFDTSVAGESTTSGIIPTKIDPNASIKCYPGPEWHRLNVGQRSDILSQDFEIDNQSDRMGYRLSGGTIKSPDFDILSSPVMPGTVQLLPSGNPLILMRDCQTTGGYPRVLQIREDCINQVAQRQPGEPINFELIL